MSDISVAKPSDAATVDVDHEAVILSDAVRTHLKDTYFLSRDDWDTVEKILSWFASDAWFAKPQDHSITQTEFFAVYDEDGDACTDMMASSDFLGKNDPLFSADAIYVAEFECLSPQEYDRYYQDFLEGEKERKESRHDFALWQAIGTYLQTEFKIPLKNQIVFRPSCIDYDKKSEAQLPLKKDFEDAMSRFFQSINRAGFAGFMSPEQKRNVAEMLLVLLEENPMETRHLLEMMSYFEKNPQFVASALGSFKNYFEDKLPHVFDDKPDFSVLESYPLSLTQATAYARFWFEPAWYWNEGFVDLLEDSFAKARETGQWSDATPRATYTFYADGRIEMEWRTE